MLNSSSPAGDPGGSSSLEQLQQNIDSVQRNLLNFSSALNSLLGGPQLLNIQPDILNHENSLQLKNCYGFLMSLNSDITLLLDRTQLYLRNSSPSQLTSSSPLSTQCPAWFSQFANDSARRFDALEKHVHELKASKVNSLAGPKMSPPSPGIAISNLHNGLFVSGQPYKQASISKPQGKQPLHSIAKRAPLHSNLQNLPTQQKSKFAIFPGARDDPNKPSTFSQAQIDEIKTKCKAIQASVFLTGKSNTPIIGHNSMDTNELLSFIKESFPLYCIEISTSKWVKLFLHRIDHPNAVGIHRASTLSEKSSMFLHFLGEENPSLQDLCTPYFAKVISSSLSDSAGTYGNPFLRISLLVHPDFYNQFCSSSLHLGQCDFRWKEDTTITKCFVCSQLGHNDPNCKNSPSCPFCGLGHSLQLCSVFNPDLPISENISIFKLKTDQDINCGLCASDVHGHPSGHSGLDRTSCLTYQYARERKYGELAIPIPNASPDHFKQYLKAAGAQKQSPLDPQLSPDPDLTLLSGRIRENEQSLEEPSKRPNTNQSPNPQV